jgi:gas vesicle protein
VFEEDYDTAVGAPIVLKRNLVARSLKEGQTLEIISDGVSLRALNGAEEVQSYCCGLWSKATDLVPSKIKHLTDQISALKDVVKNDNNLINKFSAGAEVIKSSVNGLKESAIKQTKEINKSFDDLVKKITDLADTSDDDIKKKWNEINPKIDSTLLILNLLGGLLPEKVKTSLTTLTTNLNDVKEAVANQADDLSEAGKEKTLKHNLCLRA